MKKSMKWYYTVIRWIDTSGRGIISEYHCKACELKKARKKAEQAFWDQCKTLYGTTQDIEIRQMDTTKIISGLHNQRKWNNPR